MAEMNEIERVREGMAKWLAAVIENGEPYDDYESMAWSEFSGGEEMADAFRELADQILKIKGLLIEADDQNMPPITDNADSSVWGIAFTQGMIEAYHQMGVHGWRKVVEIPFS